jgi:uncharacterized repeat protein (TIGR01451 family)
MRKRMMKLLLGITTCLVLMGLGMGVVHASYTAQNKASLNFRSSRGTLTTVTDTASVRIVNGPNVSIAKDVRNVRSNETSTDIVSALHGDTIEFILSITNSGDDYGRNVVIIDTIPFGTVYETGSARDTNSFDLLTPPDTIVFQHETVDVFDEYDTTTVTAIKWIWSKVEGVESTGTHIRTAKFKVRIP